MHVRRVQAADLPVLAEVAAQAMLDDELFAYLCPQRREYYSDYRLAFQRRLRDKSLKPEYVIMVAETDPPDATVVGYCVWELIGRATVQNGSPSLTKEWWEGIEEQTGTLMERIGSWLFPDRSVDQSRLDHYQSLATDCFPFDTYPDLLFLSTLAVHPAHQRQGVGRSLVQWGLDQAMQDELPVGLEASIKGTRLYESLGFSTVHDVHLVDGIQITAMLWQPPNMRRD